MAWRQQRFPSEEILELLGADQLAQISKTLFTNLARCLDSDHFQVVERALFLWNNEYIVQQITNFKSTIFPIVFESLAKNAEGHWNSTVHGLTCNVVKLFMEMDSSLFDQCSNQYRDEQEKLQEQEKLKGEYEARLEELQLQMEGFGRDRLEKELGQLRARMAATATSVCVCGRM